MPSLQAKNMLCLIVSHVWHYNQSSSLIHEGERCILRDFEDEDSLDQGEIEITDLDPQHKRKIMSAIWQYGKLHQPQVRVCMTIFRVAGVAILTLAILSPLLAHTSHTSIGTKAAPGVPAVATSVQQNAHCARLTIAEAIADGVIIVSTNQSFSAPNIDSIAANGGTSITWIVSDPPQKAATVYYCIQDNEVHQLPASNLPIHRHPSSKPYIH
jgi:hypothetical protein